MKCPSKQRAVENSSSAVSAVESKVVKFLDAEYKKSDLKDAVPSHLDLSQGSTLYFLLTKYEAILEGKFGTMSGFSYRIPIRQDSKPFAYTTLRIPHVSVQTVKNQIKRLVDIGVIAIY
jgi:hypothetical protein